MSKIKKTNIPVTIDEDNLMKIALEQGVIEDKYNWKLFREKDNLINLIKQSKDIMWLEWNDDSSFKAKHNKIGIGYSLLMSPFNSYFTWQTTGVTQIIEQRENYIKFNTKNSVYELHKLV